MAGYIKNIHDLEKLLYTTEGTRYLDAEDMQYIFKKGAGGITTAVTGVQNPIYGAMAWAQFNQEANLSAVLPKLFWSRSGVRAITERAYTLGSGGVAESAAVGEPYRPKITLFKQTPKIIKHEFEMSEVAQILADDGIDDTYPSLNQIRAYMAREHTEHINKMLLTDFDTLAGNNLESLDRVISSHSEVSSPGIGAHPGDADIYGIDRDAGPSWADAYVDHNNNVDRDLTEDLLRRCLRTVQENGGNPTMWLTGPDTLSRIEGLFEQRTRYSPLKEMLVQTGVDGIKTEEGLTVGTKVAVLYGLPVIVSKDVPKDTISRIYLLDTSDPEGFGEPRLYLKMLRTTQYFEAGMSKGDPYTVGKLATMGCYRTIGELTCTMFKAQGKIRDLK